MAFKFNDLEKPRKIRNLIHTLRQMLPERFYSVSAAASAFLSCQMHCSQHKLIKSV